MLKSVSIPFGNTTSELPFRINRIFPQMRKLEMYPNEFSNTEFINFPYLDELKIDLDSSTY